MFILYYTCLFCAIHVYFALFIFILRYISLFCAIFLYFVLFIFTLRYKSLFCVIHFSFALYMFILRYSSLFCAIHIYFARLIFILRHTCLFCAIHVYFALYMFISISVHNQNVPIFTPNLLFCFQPSAATSLQLDVALFAVTAVYRRLSLQCLNIYKFPLWFSFNIKVISAVSDTNAQGTIIIAHCSFTENCKIDLQSITVLKYTSFPFTQTVVLDVNISYHVSHFYEGWNFNSGNYLFTTDTK